MESHDAEQLEMIARARAAVADRLITPWWYHPALGLLLAGFTVGYSLGNTVVKLLTVALFAAGVVALVNAYRRLTGLWINGLDAGSATPWARALGAVVALGLMASAMIGYWTDLVWPVLALAALLFVLTILLGRRFDVALRAGLRSGA